MLWELAVPLLIALVVLGLIALVLRRIDALEFRAWRVSRDRRATRADSVPPEEG